VEDIEVAFRPSPAHFTLVTTSNPGYSDIKVLKVIINGKFDKKKLENFWILQGCKDKLREVYMKEVQ
jgi:hypothetical protein